MGKVYRNLATKEDRLWWQFVENTAEKVRAWPAWKRGETTEKAIPELRLLVEKRAFLKGCELAAKEELENKTEELEARGKKVLSEIKLEIKDYRQKIKHIEKLINKARKKSGASESVMEAASRTVASWSPSKRAAFELRTDLKLPNNK